MVNSMEDAKLMSCHGTLAPREGVRRFIGGRGPLEESEPVIEHWFSSDEASCIRGGEWPVRVRAYSGLLRLV